MHAVGIALVVQALLREQMGRMEQADSRRAQYHAHECCFPWPFIRALPPLPTPGPPPHQPPLSVPMKLLSRAAGETLSMRRATCKGLALRKAAAPCEMMQSRSISPNRRPPSRARPSTGCRVRICTGPRPLQGQAQAERRHDHPGILSVPAWVPTGCPCGNLPTSLATAACPCV